MTFYDDNKCCIFSHICTVLRYTYLFLKHLSNVLFLSQQPAIGSLFGMITKEQLDRVVFIVAPVCGLIALILLLAIALTLLCSQQRRKRNASVRNNNNDGHRTGHVSGSSVSGMHH